MDQPGTSREDQGSIVEDLSNNDAEFISKQLNNIFIKLKQTIEQKDVDKFKHHINILHTVCDRASIQQCVLNNNIDLFCLISEHSQIEMFEYLLDQTQLLVYLSPLDTAQRNHNIETTFLNCMLNGDITLLEKFYDYWAGDLHWVFNRASSINDNENLSNLCILLKNAEDKFKTSSAIKSCDLQKLTDIRCIVFFNEFQIDLYENLNLVKDEINKWQALSNYNDIIRREIEVIRQMIGIIFDLHEKYSDRVLTEAVEKEQDANDITFFWSASAFYMYKTFFWKIDYNVCLLVLDNIFLLKRRLIMQNNTYQNLESMLYHFIYHFKTKWAFYLSKTEIQEGEHIANINGNVIQIYKQPFKLDVGGIMRYLIMYLEREAFIDILKTFKEKLHEPILDEYIREKDSKFTDEELHSLTTFPEMRDDFSLKKMLRYLQALPSVCDIKKNREWAQLLLERILLVVGEFLKSRKESNNLEATTRALIMAEIPIDIVESLHDIRDYLSKGNNCRILWRMEIAKHGECIFEKLLQDLLHVREAIKKVISINRYFVNRSLIKFGFKVLIDRNDSIRNNIDMPDYMYDCHSRLAGGMISHAMGTFMLNDCYIEHWKKYDLSRWLLSEVAQIHHDLEMLQNKKNQEMIRIKKFMTKNFLHYKRVINNLLQKIILQKSKWTDMKLALPTMVTDLTLEDHPNFDDVYKLKNYLCQSNCEDVNADLIDFVSTYTDVESMWDLIERLFEFMIQKTKIFDGTIEELKFNMFTYYYTQLCKSGYKGDNIEYNIKNLLKLIENHCTPKTLGSKSNSMHMFDGIKEFLDILNIEKCKKQFLTEEEIQYIHEHMPKNCKYKYLIYNSSGGRFFADMEENIKTILAMEPFDTMSEKIMRSVNVNERDSELLKCYIKRLKLLSTIINGQPRDYLVIRYKYNAQFRIWLEMILIDILFISDKCKRKDTLQKQNKLLTEINVRNVLAHGNPLLEVIGDVLDANDFPGELINKSLELIADLDSVQALLELRNIGFSFANINNIEDSHNISDCEKRLLETFKRSDHWRNYLQLIPEYVDYIWSKTKLEREKEKKEKLRLIEAAKAGMAIEQVANIIDKVDIHFVDELGNAAIHYAAMNGNVDLLRLLVSEHANLNLINKENNYTALHYAAFKGHAEAVQFLINSGAIVVKDKNGHTYKDIEIIQAEKSQKRAEERAQEIEFVADDFSLFNLED